jgi:hypothetical protein
MSDVCDAPIELGTQQITGRRGMKMEVRQQYVPPLDGSKDQVDAFDTWIARRIAELLVQHYFGYSWQVVAESRQGIVYFAIPDLMGPTLKWVIRLAQYSDLTPDLIKRSAGELLERMGLRRGQMDPAEYHAALGRRHTFDFSDIQSGRKQG